VINKHLYGVSGFALTYLAVGALIMLAVALVASAIPAVRAARVDPNRILQVE
jgi:ABC-type antimicrobial peptide transport system permease subunit